MKKSATTQSNVFTNAFGTDDNMLNRLAVLQKLQERFRHLTGLTFDTIIIPSNCYALEKTIKSIMASNQIVGSANNDVNIQKGKWNLIVDHMWEARSGSEPYILMASEAQKKYGALRWITREELDVRNWIDENTRNLEWSGRCRFSIMPYMWQGFARRCVCRYNIIIVKLWERGAIPSLIKEVNMKIGDIIVADGKKRRIVSFTVVEGREAPNTEPVEADVEVETEVENPEEPEKDTEGESEEPEKETEGESEEPNETESEELELVCQYCKVCGSPIGLKAHERACEKNPESKNYKGE